MEPFVPWIKFVHLTALAAWCAGLFAMPVLLALQPGATGRVDRRRLRAAARFTYIMLVSPAAVIAVVSGTLLVHPTGSYAGWLLAKLTLVTGMVFFHAACGKLLLQTQKQPRHRPAAFHLALLAVPTLLIPGVLWLVLAQPRLA